MPEGFETRPDLQGRPDKQADALSRLIAHAREGHLYDADGQLVPDPNPDLRGFYGLVAVPPDDDTGATYTDGAGRYCFYELISSESELGAVPTQEWQQGRRQGILTAVAMDGSLTVPENSIAWFVPSEHLSGIGWKFTVLTIPDDTDCEIEDETLRCDEVTGKLHSWTRTVGTTRGCISATEYVDGGAIDCGGSGGPCAEVEYDTRCVNNVWYRFQRTIYTDAGCVEATDWVSLGPVSCPPIYPACSPVLLYRTVCLPCDESGVGSGPSPSRLAVLVRRLTRGATCDTVGPETLAYFLPVLCDATPCPPDPTCPACETDVDTDCCDAVPCDLCVSLSAAGDCSATTLTISKGTDPIDFGGESVCGWTASPFSYGACTFTLSLACLGGKGIAPAGWNLLVTDSATGVSFVAPCFIDSCSPISLTATIPLDGGTCCGADAVGVSVNITPAPCTTADSGCAPTTACGQCPDGAPLTYTVDLSWLVTQGYTYYTPLSTAGVLLSWRGGCVWRYEVFGSNGLPPVPLVGIYAATLYHDGASWLFRIEAPDGTYFQGEPGSAGALSALAFDCTLGGSFSGPGTDAVRNNWDYGGGLGVLDAALVPGADCSGGGGGLPVGCCPDRSPLPTTLEVSLSGGTSGSSTVTRGAGPWTGDVTTACLASGVHFELSCTGEVWSLQITSGCDSRTITGGTLLSCSPKVHVRFTWTSACCSAVPITVDFLEP